MAASTSNQPKESPKPGFKSREDYLAFLESNRKAKGDAWYNRKKDEMAKRDAAFEQKRSKQAQDRKLADEAWRQLIDQWGQSGGFEQAISHFALGEGEKRPGSLRRFHPGGVAFDVDFRSQKCTRWDGGLFSNGKRGRSGVIGVSRCILELNGMTDSYKTACEILSGISGISRGDIKITEETKKGLEDMRVRREAEEAAEKEAAKREDPMSKEDVEIAPVRIEDPKQIERLTAIMAKERKFPLEYARRMVAEGTVYFALYRWRDEEKGNKVVDTNRPIVTSNVVGFETGTHVGFSSRELKEFYSGPAKGKNLGEINKGAVVIGNWGEETRQVTFTEGVYDACALRYMREKGNKPLRPDEAILALTGSRRPERVLELCKQRNCKVICALDNDVAGRKMARDVAEWCHENGVECEIRLPSRGEFTLTLPDDPWGRQYYTELTSRFSDGDIKHLFQPPSDGKLQMVVETTDGSCDIYSELRKRDDVERHETMRTEKAKQIGPVRLEIEWHRKDWNELLQKQYSPRAGTSTGLPSEIDSEECPESPEDQLIAYLERQGLQPEEIDSLRENGLVYASKLGGKLGAVWNCLDPESRVATGFFYESFTGDSRTRAGLAEHTGIAFGSPGDSTTLAVSDSLEHAAEAWRLGSGEICSFCSIGLDVPSVAIELAQKHSLAVAPAFGANDSAVDKEARLSVIARQHALKMGSLPEPESPSVGMAGP